MAEPTPERVERWAAHFRYLRDIQNALNDTTDIARAAIALADAEAAEHANPVAEMVRISQEIGEE